MISRGLIGRGDRSQNDGVTVIAGMRALRNDLLVPAECSTMGEPMRESGRLRGQHGAEREQGRTKAHRNAG